MEVEERRVSIDVERGRMKGREKKLSARHRATPTKTTGKSAFSTATSPTTVTRNATISRW